jgi:hypothetical protein
VAYKYSHFEFVLGIYSERQFNLVDFLYDEVINS